MRAYLDRHFLNAESLVHRAGISLATLQQLVDLHMIPAPSYVVDAAGKVTSLVFGQSAATDALPGRYFPAAQVAWIERAQQMIARVGLQGASAELGREFFEFFLDAFPDDEQCEKCTDIVTHFLAGTYGVCVVHPDSAQKIAAKEIAQDCLVALTENGQKKIYRPDELPALRDAIAAYDVIAMPFSPVDYPRSSRKRLIDDVCRVIS